MRNLKKLLAVILTICVLATVMVPAFAETKSDSDICADLGVILGTGDGVTAEYLATQPDRLQGAIMYLRLRGLEADAKAFTGTDNFSDVEGLNADNTAILAYLKANPELGFAGIGDNKFAPLEKMSAKEYYKVLLTALGYDYGTDFTWSTVFSFAASIGLIKLVDNDTFTVDDLCIGTVEALKLTVKGGTDTLIATLVDSGSIAADKATASGLYTTVAKALEVVSATADNLKTAKFVFNKELDSTTVKKANFSGADNVKLLDDKKTVVATIEPAKTAQSQTTDFVIENVKSTDGVAIAKVTKTVKFEDTTKPVVTGVTALNGKTIVLAASEPLANLDFNYNAIFSDIKIDDITLIGTSVMDPFKNTVTFTLLTAIAAGEHKIDVAKVKDFAGFQADAQSFNFSVAEDVTAPSIISAEYVSNTKVKVTFNENLATVGDFWINDKVATAAIGDTAAEYTLTMTTGSLDIGATVEVRIAYQNQKDVMGNAVTTKVTYTGLKVADDTTLPTVTAAIGAKNKLTLNFSKNMLKEGTVKVLKASDSSELVTLSLTNAAYWKDTLNKVEFTGTEAGLNATDGMAIKVKVTGAKDATVRNNALAETVIELTAIDTNAPTAKAHYTVAGTGTANDTITFYFSEAMNADTLANLSNYVLATGGAVLTDKVALSASGATLKSVASDGKSVTFKLANISGATNEAFTVYALKDLADNMLATSAVTKVTGAAPTINPLLVKATAGNKIEVVYSEDIGTADPNAFIIRETIAADATPSAIVIGTAVSGTKVTLTLDRDIGTATTKAFLAYKNNELVKSFYGVKAATSGSIAVVDGIKPTVSFATTNGGILINFSEAVTTNANLLKAEMQLSKAGTPVVIDPLNISQISAKQWKIGALENGKAYSISLFPVAGTAGTVDAGTNAFVATGTVTITPAQ